MPAPSDKSAWIRADNRAIDPKMLSPLDVRALIAVSLAVFFVRLNRSALGDNTEVRASEVGRYVVFWCEWDFDKELREPIKNATRFYRTCAPFQRVMSPTFYNPFVARAAEAVGLADVPEFRRASGDAVCALCGLEYRRHPTTEHRWNDAPWLHRLCDGSLVKL